MEYYSTMKKNQLLTHETVYMNLKRNYTEWKKPVTTGCTFYDSFTYFS